jgi:hypothetical protein
MTSIDSGTTLDIRPAPGRDTRFAATSAESAFTFGTFRIDNAKPNDNFTETTLDSTLSFGPYSTIESSKSDDFDVLKIITTKSNELNLRPDDASSYAYFGSFYTKVANAINNIVDTFPYALLSKSINSGVTIYDYSHDLVQQKSIFKISLSSITNQSDIIYVSGRSEQSESQIDLYNDTSSFAIQLSGESQSTITGSTFMNEIHEINSYDYLYGQYLEFEINGILLPEEAMSASTFSYPIYVRPTRQRVGQFKRTLPNLETQLIYDGNLMVPNSDTGTYSRVKFDWPKTIDGFAPDSYGNSFETYASKILKNAKNIDEEKTNIMLRTMLPENFTDLDSQDDSYRKITTVYAEQFDTIKQYIDGIAYAHSVTYSGSESVPNKFLSRLADMLGAKLPNAFNADDVIDYLAGEFDSTGKSFEEYNLEIWRRIMVNIVWLYKKRGTRDAISFVFKLIGAPKCLFNLEEFVYDVKNVQRSFNLNLDAEGDNSTFNVESFPQIGTFIDTTDGGTIKFPVNPVDGQLFSPEDINNPESFIPANLFDDLNSDELQDSSPLDLNGNIIINDGYPNVNSQIFQIGGSGTGNGADFIEGLGSQYEPFKRVDNLKTKTGNTRHIVNSKEVNVDLRPSRAIECDVMDWYEFGYGWWKWGSSSSVFSGLTVPFEWQVEDINTVVPDNLTGMTIYEWINYLYQNNVDPKNRKTKGWQNGTTGTYRDLKKIYVTYMLWTNSQKSNRLTFKNLEKFLSFLERNFQDLVPFLVPSTSILSTYGTVYGNTEFNRHRFIYKPGLNDGSEFQAEIPPVFEPDIQASDFTVDISNRYDPQIKSNYFCAKVSNKVSGNIDISDFQINLGKTVNLSTNLANTNTNIYEEETIETPYEPIISNLTPVTYPD